jgi:hypothetical protein
METTMIHLKPSRATKTFLQQGPNPTSVKIYYTD